MQLHRVRIEELGFGFEEHGIATWDRRPACPSRASDYRTGLDLVLAGQAGRLSHVILIA
jgi:hypothetical protein